MRIDEQLAAAGVKVIHHFASGIYIKEMVVPAGAMIGKHLHDFDHFSSLVNGSALVEIDGVSTELHAPSLLTIAAGRLHVITALTDVVWHCIHATDETDAEKIDAALIEVEA